MQNHKVMDRLPRLETEAAGEFGEASRTALDQLDKDITAVMMGAEKRCRKMYRGAYEFSPPVKGWIEKGSAIQALIKYRQTGTGNGDNVKRATRRAGLKDTNPISTGKLAEMAQECKKRCKSLLAKSPWLRRQFLAPQLQAAVKGNDTKKAIDIKAILRAESQCRGWSAIKKGMGQNAHPPRQWWRQLTPREHECGAQRRNQWRWRFTTVCNRPLFELLRYNADTEAGAQILEGTFEPMPEAHG